MSWKWPELPIAIHLIRKQKINVFNPIPYFGVEGGGGGGVISYGAIHLVHKPKINIF